MAENQLSERSNGRQYFIRSSGRVLGPFDLDKLKALRARGRLGRADEVSTDRRTWEPAATLEELFGTGERGRRSAAETSVASEMGREQQASVHDVGPAAWFYHAGGEQQGPVTLAALRSLVARGALQADDLVWREGMPDWITVAELPELAAAPPRVPAAAPHRTGHAGGPGGYDALPPQRTSGMAVTSLILAILGIMLLGILCIPAVIFAGVALSDIGRSQGRLAGKGLAIGGLVVGVIGSVLWLIWFLFWIGVISQLL